MARSFLKVSPILLVCFAFLEYLQKDASLVMSPIRTKEQRQELDNKPSPILSTEAITALRERAMAGDPESQIYMGVLHANGTQLNHDYVQAAEWYRKAAEQGEARAQRYLGLLLSLGVGIERNREEAFHWFKEADKAGDPAASLELAAYPLFYRESIMDFRMGSFGAWRAKAFFLIDLDSTFPSFEARFWEIYGTQSSYSQNDALLAAVVQQRAEEGDAESQVDMVKLHILGQGVPVDPDAISKWLSLAVRNGEPYAQFMYGYSWDNPYFATPTYAERKKLIEMAAASGKEKFFALIHCMVKHCWILNGYEGSGTILWQNEYLNEGGAEGAYRAELTELADSEYLLAEWVLARHLSLLLDVDEEQANRIGTLAHADRQAAMLYERVARRDFVYAYVKLARIYSLGRGVEANYAKVLECVEKFRTYPDERIWQSMDYQLESWVAKENLHAMAGYFFREASNGNINAQLLSAILCGPRLLNDPEIEAKWLILAALGNDCAAYSILIRRGLLRGDEMPRDLIGFLDSMAAVTRSTSPAEVLDTKQTLESLKACFLVHGLTMYGTDEPFAIGNTMESFCRWMMQKRNCPESSSFRPGRGYLAGGTWYLHPFVEYSLMAPVTSKANENAIHDNKERAGLEKIREFRFVPLGRYPTGIFL